MSNQMGRVVTLSIYLLDPQKQHNMGECIGIHFYVASNYETNKANKKINKNKNVFKTPVSFFITTRL